MAAKKCRPSDDATLPDMESLSFDFDPDDTDLDASSGCFNTPQPASSTASASGPTEAAIPGPRQVSQGPGQQPARPPSAESLRATGCLPRFQRLRDALRDLNIPETLLQSGCAATHLQSALIGATLQCYPLREKPAARAEFLLSRRMGALVTSAAKCDRRPCLSKCASSANCAACPHSFKCNCEAKYRNTQWCPHLHLAYIAGLTDGDESCLYVHSYNYSRLQMRHLRAWVQGIEFMKPLEGDPLRFVEEVLDFDETKRKIASYLADKAEPCECGADEKCVDCGACRCRYECDCEDFTFGKQVCQHCHWVAMKRSAQAVTLFQSPPEESQYQLCKPETGPISEEVQNVRRYALELQHELSYNFKKHCLGGTFNASRTQWIFKTENPATVNKVEQRDECICQVDATLQPGKYCERCKICIYHYTCTCSDAKSVICRHIHYVARKSGRQKQGLQHRSEYLERTLFTNIPRSLESPAVE